MCGIAGVWWPSGQSEEMASTSIERMSEALRHRGPDAQGSWIDAPAGVALGHRRLAILDLSPAGAQPMLSASGRYVIVFNGEIYNHRDLRARLDAEGTNPCWRGQSDTETLLAAIETWGLGPGLRQAAGMFAFALWDRETRRLWLARDRIGEKPLYYGMVGGAFAFASELKALRRLPGFDPVVDPAAAAALLRYLYIPDPHSIHKGIAKLLPGHLIEVRGARPSIPEPWWKLEDVIAEGRPSRATLKPADLARTLGPVLSQVVRSQMLSDVPLGSLLSGGIDSSLITALMQTQSTTRVRTYSIGFDDERFNEAAHAAAVARHLGTDHTELTVTEAEAEATIPDLVTVYDEPFADSSQIPTLLLSRLARRDITVALTGDGGDEVFGGYNRYVMPPPLWRLLAPLPSVGRRAMAAGGRVAARLLGPDDTSARYAARGLGLSVPFLDRLERVSTQLGSSRCLPELYSGLVSLSGDPTELLSADLRAAGQPHALRGLPEGSMTELDASRWMMANDMLAYLPGDILVKVDRAAMASSLETRAPFLDPRVLDLAWSLPTPACIANGTGKRILREMLYRHVPQAIIDRPKQGFSVPVDRWLRGSLRGWAESLISPTAIDRTGLLNAGAVARLWRNHQSGRSDQGHRLWTVLMLQAWGLAQ